MIKVTGQGPFFYYDKNFRQRWLIPSGSKSDQNGQDIRIEKFPFGFEACLVLVDHCDFDTLQKTRAVFYGASNPNDKNYGKNGIVGTGLTATKTVFVSSEGSENIGLDNKAYRDLIKQIASAGVEIAAHSFVPKTSVGRGGKTLPKLLKQMSIFSPVTWIDHGHLKHNLTRFGADSDDKHYLLDILKVYGYEYFWSGIDYSLNSPDGNLNLLNSRGRAGRHYLVKVWRLIKEKKEPDRVLFVFFWDFVGNLLGWQAKDDLVLIINGKDFIFPLLRTLLRIINPFFYLQIVKNFFVPDAIHSAVYGIFPLTFDSRKGKSLNIYSFNSIWINDFQGGYTPANVDRLIKEGGLHIGHNYLSVEEKHYLGPAFDIGNQKNYFINEKFQENLSYMAKKQKEGRLWVANIKALGNYYKALSQVKLIKQRGNNLILKNQSSDKIKGVTLSCLVSTADRLKKVKINGKSPVGSKLVGNRLFYWFDLPPKEELILEVV